MTTDELSAYERKGFREISPGVWAKAGPGPVYIRQSSVAEPTSQPVVARENEPEAQHSGKVLVRIEDVRKRLLDTDNLVAKFHVDCLRYSGLLHSDAADQATVQVSQRKCRTGEQPHTEITIEAP